MRNANLFPDLLKMILLDNSQRKQIGDIFSRTLSSYKYGKFAEILKWSLQNFDKKTGYFATQCFECPICRNGHAFHFSGKIKKGQ